GKGIENVCAITSDVLCLGGNHLPEVMLRENINGEVVIGHGDVLMLAHFFQKRPLDLLASNIFVVQNAMLGVPALFCEVEIAFFILIERNAEVDEFLYALGGLGDHHFYDLFIAEPCSGIEGVL